MSSPRDDDRQTWRIPSTDPLWDHEAVDWEETDFTRWLEGQEAARRPPAGEAVATRWVLEFDCKQSSSGGRRSRPLFHCEEAWSMCVQMWSEGLHVEHRCSKDRRKLLLLVGATQDVLSAEATRIRLLMRMRHTRGMTPFDPDLVHHYVPAASGRTFNSAREQQLVLSRLHRAMLVDLDSRQRLRSRVDLLHELRYKLAANQPIKAKLLKQLMTAFGATMAGRHAKSIGPITVKAAHLVTVDGAFVVYPDERSHLNLAESVQQHTQQTAHQTAQAVLGVGEAIAEVGLSLLADPTGSGVSLPSQPFHRSTPQQQMERRQRHKYAAMDVQPLMWSELTELRKELTSWADGRGRHERFTGLFRAYFPTHDYDELGPLRASWTNPVLRMVGPDLVIRMHISARLPEGKETEGSFYSLNNVDVKQSALFYQPIDEIHDYFGADVSMYVAWVGIYTQALVWPSLLGMFVVCVGLVRSFDIDPNRNALTPLFSLFIALWSLIFILRWERRWYELSFLWGTDAAALSTPTRPEFHGKLQINFVTGQEAEVDEFRRKVFRRLVSWTAIAVVLAANVAANAYAKHIPAWVDDLTTDGSGSGDSSASMIYEEGDSFVVATSAVCTVAVQAVFTMFFHSIAKRLNDWENHRLHVEYDRALVYKLFVLEFANNFIIVLWLTFGDECRWSSCLDDVQLKLFIIFTLKNYLGRAVELASPWVLVGWNKLCGKSWSHQPASDPTDRDEGTTLHVRGIGGQCESEAALRQVFGQFGAVSDTGILIRHRVQNGENASWALVTMDDADAADAALSATSYTLEQTTVELTVGRYNRAQAERSTGAMEAARHRALAEEEQSTLEGWTQKGLFDDTCTMVVQFGYIALFAAACPLTPLLALINNITEIRSDAFRVTTLMKRPEWKPPDCIGAWHTVVRALAVVSVLVNAMTLCFAGSQMSKFAIVDDPESMWKMLTTGAFLRVPHEEALDSGLDISEVRFVRDLEQGGRGARFQSWQLWVLCLLIEHAVLLLRAAVQSIYPTESKWVAAARDTLAHQQSWMRTSADTMASQIFDVRRELIKLREIDNVSSEVRAVWKFLDERSIGMLKPEQLERLCALVGLPGDDVHELMHEMQRKSRTNDRRYATYTEFAEWWEQYRTVAFSFFSTESCRSRGDLVRSISTLPTCRGQRQREASRVVHVDNPLHAL